jgi:3-oxoacyl-[acyl-carrier protein] reductase
MIRRGSGSIINITSVAAYVGAATEGPYAAAKAALHSLTRTIASECGPAGVRCNAVAPGLVHSKFLERHAETFEGERSRTPLQRFAEPAEVASVVEFLASEAASYITGEVVNVSGGWYYRP